MMMMLQYALYKFNLIKPESEEKRYYSENVI